MGLDISPGEFYMPYSRFARFRHALALEDNINLRMMWGFLEADQYELPATTPEGEQWLRIYGRAILTWDQVSSPLVPLLDHSDCDGELTRPQCIEMLPRLREIHEKWLLREPEKGFARALGLLIEAAETVVNRDADVLEFC